MHTLDLCALHGAPHAMQPSCPPENGSLSFPDVGGTNAPFENRKGGCAGPVCFPKLRTSFSFRGNTIRTGTTQITSVEALMLLCSRERERERGREGAAPGAHETRKGAREEPAKYGKPATPVATKWAPVSRLRYGGADAHAKLQGPLWRCVYISLHFMTLVNPSMFSAATCPQRPGIILGWWRGH